MPPLLGVLGKACPRHGGGQPKPSLVPEGHLALRVLRSCSGVVIGVGDRSKGIDGAAHVQRLPQGAAKGEIDGGTCAVGGRCRRILTRRGPENPHLLAHRLPGRTGALWIQAPLSTGLCRGVGHHEPLNGHWPPGIKDRQAPMGLFLLQQRLGLQQPRDHPRAQPKGAGAWSVGSA